MNREIHELINMKSRREELEVECGNSKVLQGHLSTQQILHIEKDLQHEFYPEIVLEMVNSTISIDENIIFDRHH